MSKNNTTIDDGKIGSSSLVKVGAVKSKFNVFSKARWSSLISQHKFVSLLCIVVLLVGFTTTYLVIRNRVKLPPGLTTDQQYNYLADHHDYKGAEKILEKKLQSAKTKSDKVAIYSKQSALALKFDDIKAAKTYVDKALQLDPNDISTFTAAAYLAQASGDKTLAKHYWQEAIDHLNPNVNGYNLIKNDLQISLENVK